MVKSSILFIIPYIYFSYSLPGIIFGFSSSGINSFIQDFLPSFESSLKSVVIPELIVPMLQRKGLAIDLYLEHIKTTSIYIDSSNSGLSFGPNNEIHFTIPELIATFKFNWEIKSHSSSEPAQKGSGRISITNARQDTIIKIGNSAKDAFAIQKNEFKVEKFEVYFEEPSGIYNWVLEAANNKLKNILESTLTQETRKFFEGLLGGVKSFKLNDEVEVDLSLEAAPKMDSKHLELFINGTGRVIGNNDPVHMENEFDLKYTSSKDFGIFISEYTVNTIILAQHKKNPIKFNSEDFGLNITTDILEPVFEGINKEFGPDKDVNIICQAAISPSIKFTEDLVNSNLQLQCTFSSESQKIIDLTLNFILKISLKMSRNLIKPSIEDCKLDSITNINSYLKKEVNSQGIKNLVNLSLTLWKGLISQIVFEQEIELPELFKLFTKDAHFEVEIGYLRIEGNTYFPSSN